jgi:hypothetical protein
MPERPYGCFAQMGSVPFSSEKTVRVPFFSPPFFSSLKWSGVH